MISIETKVFAFLEALASQGYPWEVFRSSNLSSYVLQVQLALTAFPRGAEIPTLYSVSLAAWIMHGTEYPFWATEPPAGQRFSFLIDVRADNHLQRKLRCAGDGSYSIRAMLQLLREE